MKAGVGAMLVGAAAGGLNQDANAQVRVSLLPTTPYGTIHESYPDTGHYLMVNVDSTSEPNAVGGITWQIETTENPKEMTKGYLIDGFVKPNPTYRLQNIFGVNDFFAGCNMSSSSNKVSFTDNYRFTSWGDGVVGGNGIVGAYRVSINEDVQPSKLTVKLKNVQAYDTQGNPLETISESTDLYVIPNTLDNMN